MPPKARVPAPIDRPLSRAYLREFTGWSTAYSPGLSEPTSLRVMENMSVNRDGSLRIRPGLRYLSYTVPPADDVPGVGIGQQCVGSHEAFFLNDGTKAYLFAVREEDDTVGFRVLSFTVAGNVVRHLTEAGIGFDVPQTEEVLNFSAATTYVKYLQIDNKIFALSNAGEPMRLFTVGAVKTARRLSSINRPNFDVADKLAVVKPDGPWMTSGVATGVRTNKAINPGFENALAGVTTIGRTVAEISSTQHKSGTKSLRLSSAPTRSNLMSRPLGDVPSSGITGWSAYGVSTDSVEANGTACRVNSTTGAVGNRFYVQGPSCAATPGKQYTVDQSLVSQSDVSKLECMVNFYGSTGAQIGASQVLNVGLTGGRRATGPYTAPDGATTMRVFYRATKGATGVCRFNFNQVVLVPYGESTAYFDGSSGTNYFWAGGVQTSASYYHPPQTVQVKLNAGTATPAATVSSSLQVRAETTARNAVLTLQFSDASGAVTGSSSTAPTADSNTAWTALTRSMTVPAASTATDQLVSFAAVPRGEYHYVDEQLVEKAASLGAYFDGSTSPTTTQTYAWTGTANASSSTETTHGTASTIPPAETPTANTLISSTASANTYSFAYFYTFSNEVGESAASQVTVVKTQRSQQAWKWESNSATGEPTGTSIDNPEVATDQLVAYMPQAAYDAAKAQGAISWNLYMLTWSDQDPVPPEGLLVDSKKITAAGTYGEQGWIRHTPQNIDASASLPLPTAGNRQNYSSPSSGANGLVAADRLVMVLDPAAAAVIRWSSNQVGEYTNFSASKGGGYKTLTAGNLFVPACVKLWQNSQSVDTLTILCLGVDGYSTAYYMAPAQVTSQTDAVSLMGFEETTSTPGTCSPYGVETLNNALYHPQETELVKSSIAMYNVNHKTLTDLISNMWSALLDKQKLISSQLDNRLYYLVHNPYGEPLEAGCWGNEIWIYDTVAQTGSWSRWLVQGASLRKIEVGDRLVMSVVRPDGLFYFDNQFDVASPSRDQYVDPDSGEVLERAIDWRCETNTQGANRAHDAWAHLQQANVVLGNFTGTMRYGVRAQDRHGKWVDISKVVTDGKAVPEDGLPFDLEDFLLIRKDLKEWRFYAQAEHAADGTVLPSTGQLNLVQYRYTPVSVNVGYEQGSIETFEYGRNAANGADGYSANGVPMPLVDLSRP
jgi:hypothetical protein